MLGGGLPEGMDPEMAAHHQKSAFMELQNQGMGGPGGMGHPAYNIRTSYQGHPGNGGGYSDATGLTSAQSSRLGYPFSMNHMSVSPGSYNHGGPTHPFSMPPYHQTSSPPRDGMYTHMFHLSSWWSNHFNLQITHYYLMIQVKYVFTMY